MASEAVEVERVSRSSIEISKDAKGEYRWTIKIYWDSETEGHQQAIERLDAIDVDLRMRFLAGEKRNRP